MYDRKSVRLKGFDYNRRGWYFITLCSHKRKNIFGKVDEDGLVLFDLGKLVKKCLKGLENRFKVVLDQYVVMPNHIHMIIKINERAILESPVQMGIDERAILESPVQMGIDVGANHDSPKKRSLLSKMIGYFKADVSRKCGIRVWHRNYYDRIIRNKFELGRIRKYIKLNPTTWHRDRENVGRKGDS